MLVLAIVALFLAYQIYRSIKWQLITPDFSGKTVFITGASSGIGEELAKQVVRYKAKRVILAARRLDELERVKKECNASQNQQIDIV
jgi:NADP-dependent 3-hydroxy acid dehydrogenase YdfG